MLKKFVIIIVLLNLYYSVFSQTPWTFNVNVFGGPVFHVFDKSIRENISQRINYSYGITIGTSFLPTNKISIKTGIFVSSKKFEILYKNIPHFEIDYIKIKYFYSNIPIIIEYKENYGKFFPFISSGFIIGKIIQSDIYYFYKDGSSILNNEDADYDNKNPYYFTASIGLYYKINDTFSLRFEPYIIDCIHNNYPVGPDSLSKLAFGVRAGIAYNFCFNL